MEELKHKLKVCCVFNIAPLYKTAIFRQMSSNKDIDYSFFVGRESPEIEALIDMSSIKGFKRYLRNVYVRNKLVWQYGFMRTLFTKYDAYILTGNADTKSNWLIILIAHILRRKVFVWSNGLFENETKLQQTKNLFYMKFAGNLLLHGRRAWYILKKKGFKKERMSVVFNSLNYDLHFRLRDKYINAGYMRNYFGNNYPVITFVGRLIKIKSLDLLIQAVALLKVQNIDVNILFLGTGTERKKLEAQTKELSIDDRVWFYGACYDEEMIASVLQNSTLCVNPGDVGLTAIHALTYGVPVITHNKYSVQMPEFESITSDINGDFFKYGDVFSLSEVIEKWINIMKDTNRVVKVKSECYKVVDMYYNPKQQEKAISNAVLRCCKR